MNTYKSKLLAALVAALFAAIPSIGFAANATYSPSSKTLAGALPYSSDYMLTITSPDSLNPTGTAKLPSPGITIDLKVTVSSAPVGVSNVTALSYVSFSVPTLHYTALNQGRDVTVHVNVPSGAAEGDYVYSIQGDPPNALGWGVGSASLTVSVSEPVATDTTPPTVEITAPADGAGYSFCLDGRSVEISVSANDAESAVTAVAATVNGESVALSASGLGTNDVTASGTYTALSIGSYLIEAWATSAGGTSDPVTASFSVSYDLTWLPPLSLGKTDKGGSTVPVKFTIKDCEGRFVRDETVSVAAFRNNSVDPVFVATFGDGSDFVRIDEGDPLLETDGHYIANLKTATGPGTYLIVVYFGGTANGSPVEAIQQGSKSFNTR